MSPPARQSHVFVGQFDERGRRHDDSAMAGSTKDIYVGCVLDPQNALIGTSFATPQVTGLFALLQEAYPSVEPKTLRKAVMATATPLPGDTDRSEGGNGCVSPMAAFKTIFEMTGVLPVGEKGQEALLPPLFHEEVYLAFNADLMPFVPQWPPQERKSWLQRHYLLCAKKENRFYGNQFLTPSFNAALYLAGNDDLAPYVQGHPERWAFYHYVMHGRDERRLCGKELLPTDFDGGVYLMCNPDLLEFVPQESDPNEFAMLHYLRHGKSEGRRYKQ